MALSLPQNYPVPFPVAMVLSALYNSPIPFPCAHVNLTFVIGFLFFFCAFFVLGFCFCMVFFDQDHHVSPAVDLPFPGYGFQISRLYIINVFFSTA